MRCHHGPGRADGGVGFGRKDRRPGGKLSGRYFYAVAQPGRFARHVDSMRFWPGRKKRTATGGLADDRQLFSRSETARHCASISTRERLAYAHPVGRAYAPYAPYTTIHEANMQWEVVIGLETHVQ